MKGDAVVKAKYVKKVFVNLLKFCEYKLLN